MFYRCSVSRFCSLNLVMKKLFVLSISFMSLLLLFLRPAEIQSQSVTICNIILDVSAVPQLYYKDATLLIQVNDATDISLSSGRDSIPFTQAGNQLIVTTQATELSLSLSPGSQSADLCKVTPAPLRDDKKWAWSHGFDDNTFLKNAISEFRAKSWPATIFAIAKDYRIDRNENWIVDEPFYNQTLLSEGWALGNHSWNHERFDTSTPTSEDYKEDILKGQAHLEAAIGRSFAPDFRVMVFASPNFSSAYNQPFAEAMAETDLLLQETGNDYLLTVNSDSDFTAGSNTARTLTNRTQIGRDISIEFAPEQVIATIDWMSNNQSSGQRFWYNSLAHGTKEANIKAVIDHVWQNYGPEGSNEAWVASSSEIYSYILKRDAMKINVEITGQAIDPALENKVYIPAIQSMRNWTTSMSTEEEKTQVQPFLLHLSGRGLQQLKER